MIRYRQHIVLCILFVVLIMQSITILAFADRNDGLYKEYDDAGCIVIESEYRDGQRYHEYQYDYYENGNLKSVREKYGPDREGYMDETHYDRSGHMMEVSRLPFAEWTFPGVGHMANETEPLYKYDSLGRLVQFETDIHWFDSPEYTDHVIYSYLYDEQDWIKTVSIVTIHDSVSWLLPSIGKMSFSYGKNGDYYIESNYEFHDYDGTPYHSSWMTEIDREGQIVSDRMLYSDYKTDMNAVESDTLEAPTLSDLKRMLDTGDMKVKSNTGVKLVLPSEKQMLEEPFRASITNGKTHGSIYVMPKPIAGNGHIGTVDIDTEVWILAETNQFYFFLTDDGQMGWNGKTYFEQ